jgi:O-antigen/teichoic acid export membrane protein
MSTRKSLFFSFLDRYASLAISVVSSMVIARLLTPADIGVFSVTMVLLMFLSTVRDMGAGQYLVQEKELTTERIRAVWAVQLGLGLGLGFLVLLASYPVAVFYREPRMRDIMLVVALNYVINPFGSLTYAWNMREMRFDIIALIRFSATVVGAVVSAVLAWKSFGPISLALGSLASTVVNALMSTFFRPAHFPWLPGVREVKRVLKFGSQMTATDILNTMATGAPELMLGKLQGMATTGLYSRASGLVGMIGKLLIDASYSVAIGLFAKHAREKNSFAEPFTKALAYVSVLAWPACLFIVLLAHPIIRLLYGGQWDAAVDLTRLLAIAAMFHGVVAICLAGLVASGNATKILKTTIFCTLTTVVAAAVGSTTGLLGLGLAITTAAALNAAVWLAVTRRVVGISVSSLFLLFAKSGAVTMVSTLGASVAVLIYGLRPAQALLPLLLGTSLAAIAWFIAIATLNHPIFEELKPWTVKLKKWFR